MALHSKKLLPEREKPGPYQYPPPPAGKHQSSTVLVLTLGIVGALLLFLSYFVMRNFASRRRSSPPLANYNNTEGFTGELREPVIDHPIWYIRTVGLPQSVVDSIQIVSYKKGEGLIETSDCSVCLSEFEEGERLRLLPKCSHAFHVSCIDTWLGSHTNCPLCRAPILVVNGNQSESSSSESGSIEDDGVMIHEHEEEEEEEEEEEDEEMEAVRRSFSMDISSDVERHKSVKRSISFSLYASELK